MAIANNALTTTGAKKPSFTVALQSDGMQRMISTTFNGDRKLMTRFTSDIMAAVTATPLLKNCDPATVVAAGLQCAALNLSTSPSMGEAWIIPYGDKATFQLGKNGLVQLAIRTGLYRDIDTMEVRQGEYKGRDKRTGKPVFEFIEDDEVREELPIVGYLAWFEMTNGFTKSVYFSHEKMLKWAARYSQAFDIKLYAKYITYQKTGEGMTENELRKCSSPWYERFDSMAEKTVLRQLLTKWGAKSRDFIDALEKDIKAEEAQDDGGFFENAPETASNEPVTASEPVNEQEPTKAPEKAEKPKSKRVNANAKEPEQFDTQDDGFFN